MWLTAQDVQVDIRGINAEYVGLENWRHIGEDATLGPIVRTTIYFTGVVVLASLLLGLGIALLLNQEFTGRG